MIEHSRWKMLLWTVAAASMVCPQVRGQAPRPAVDSTYESSFGISPAEYRSRRVALMARMDSGSVAVFRAAEVKNRNGDVDYRYRQNSQFLYLTGCDEPGATLLLVPGGTQVDSATAAKEILFIRPASKSWTGEGMGLEGARNELGFGNADGGSAVLPPDKLNGILSPLLEKSKVLYFDSPLPTVSDPVSGRRFVPRRDIAAALQERYPALELRSLGPALALLRSVKSAAERRLMQRAIDATTLAQREAMKSCAPGMAEYELQAVIEYCFTRSGAEYTGFPSIVGSGPNALLFHYDANRRVMHEGEMVVMDIGAEYHGYSADVTRSIPVNGKFSRPQRELYEIVLRAHDEAVKEMKSDVSSSVASKRAFDVLGEGLVRLGIIKDPGEAKKYCPHGVSHPVGLEVHDVGMMGAPMPSGAIVTIEPGLYVPPGSPCDSTYWNIGIRIEDDVLVTDGGGVVLSASAPASVDAIEKLMRRNGIGNQPVGTP